MEAWARFLKRYSFEGITRSQVQKQIIKIKASMLKRADGSVPSGLFPLPPVEDIEVTASISLASTLTENTTAPVTATENTTAPVAATENTAAPVGATSCSGRKIGGRPKGTTNEAKRNKRRNWRKRLQKHLSRS
jgi:hypothetical protein